MKKNIEKEILKLITNGNLEHATSFMLKTSKEDIKKSVVQKELVNSLIHQLSRINELEELKRKNLISHEESEITKNKIRNALITYKDQIVSLEFKNKTTFLTINGKKKATIYFIAFCIIILSLFFIAKRFIFEREEADLRIEKVLRLNGINSNSIAFDIVIANQGKKSKWIDRIELGGLLKRMAIGFEGSNYKTQYTIQLDYKKNLLTEDTLVIDSILGSAYVANDSIWGNKVDGTFKHRNKSTYISWSVKLSFPLVNEVLPESKSIIRVVLKSPTLKLSYKRGHVSPAQTLSKVIDNDHWIKLVTDERKVVKYNSENDLILGFILRQTY